MNTKSRVKIQKDNLSCNIFVFGIFICDRLINQFGTFASIIVQFRYM